MFTSSSSPFYFKLKYQTSASSSTSLRSGNGSLSSSSSRGNRPSQEVFLPRNVCMKENMIQLLHNTSSTSSIIVEVSLYEEEIQRNHHHHSSHILYFIWLGKMTDVIDTIEIPPFPPPSPQQQQSKSPSLSSFFPETTIVSVQLYPMIPTAKEITLLPKTILDWDIVQHNAQLIENHLLRSVSLITKDQELSMMISPSISASFLIEKIEYVGEILQMDSNGVMEKRMKTKKEVARINNQTQLLIQPVVEREEEKQRSTVDHLVNISKGLEERKVQRRERSILCMQNLSKLSRRCPLRVLPQRFRHLNTSFFPCGQVIELQKNVPSAQSLESLIHDNTYLDLFLDHSDSKEGEELRNRVLSNNKSEKSKMVFPWDADDPYIIEGTALNSDEIVEELAQDRQIALHYCCNAFVHPLYLKILIEKSVHCPITDEEFHEIFQELSYPMMGYVQRPILSTSHSSFSSSSLPPSLTEKSLVRIYCTHKIQPFVISLPFTTERALGLEEFDVVVLEILLNYRQSRPALITLHPIYWETTHRQVTSQISSSPFHKDRSKPPVVNTSTIAPSPGRTPSIVTPTKTTIVAPIMTSFTMNQVIDGLLRLIQQQSSSAFPFLLSDNMLISLLLPLQTDGTNSLFSSPVKLSPVKLSPLSSSKQSNGNVAVPIRTEKVDFLVRFHSDLQVKAAARTSNKLSPRNGTSFGVAEFNQEIPFVPLSYDDINYEENIYRIISLLQLEKDHPVKGFLPSTSNQFSDKHRFYSLIGLEKILKSLIDEITSHFSPFPLFQQLLSTADHSSIPPFLTRSNLTSFQLNYLLIGDVQTGKSTLLQILQEEIHKKYNTIFQCKILSVDLKAILLVSSASVQRSNGPRNVKDILQEIHQIFEQCKRSTPCLLLLDHLDHLCPNRSDASSPQNTFGNSPSSTSAVVRDERAIVISTFLQQKLKELSEFIEKKRLKAKELFMVMQQRVDSSSQYFKESVIAAFLQSSICIIATARSLSSIDPILLPSAPHGIAYFHKYFTLPTQIPVNRCNNLSLSGVLNDNRLKILQTFLQQENIPLAKKPAQEAELLLPLQEEIVSKLENFRYGDYATFMRFVKYEISLRLFEEYHLEAEHSSADHRNDNSHLAATATFEDIKSALYRYNPLAQSTDLVPNNSSLSITNNAQSLQRSYRILQQSSYLNQFHQEILEILYYPSIYAKLYRSLPVRLPKAMMLFGLPGCGKTFLAQTIGQYYFSGSASSSSVSSISSFITIKGPQLLSKYIGETEKSIRQLFQSARQQASKSSGGGGSGGGIGGILIFFDEFEALAPKRGKDNTGITDRIVNQLLTFIDGVESTMNTSATTLPSSLAKNEEIDEEEEENRSKQSSIYIIIATSRPDLIDSALLRPGRIEKHIYIGLPESPLQYQELLTSMIAPYLPEHNKIVVTDSSEVERLMQETITSISNDPKTSEFTMADLQAMIDTAYLKAVHQEIELNDHTNGIIGDSPSEAQEKIKQKIFITSTILWEAFIETKPSLHSSDRTFYEQIYSPFLPSSSSGKSSSTTAQKSMQRNAPQNPPPPLLSSGSLGERSNGHYIPLPIGINGINGNDDHPQMNLKSASMYAVDMIDQYQKLSFH